MSRGRRKLVGARVGGRPVVPGAAPLFFADEARQLALTPTPVYDMLPIVFVCAFGREPGREAIRPTTADRYRKAVDLADEFEVFSDKGVTRDPVSRRHP